MFDFLCTVYAVNGMGWKLRDLNMSLETDFNGGTFIYALCQQMDLVGPRYLSSKARYYFHSIICCDTPYAHVSALTNQRSESVCNSLIRLWKTAGIPDFLQMDNYLSFRGSLIRPNAVGKIIRLCLLHGVTPVFIPVKEPWRNGIVEHFNCTMQNAILHTGEYTNVREVQKAVDNFCEIHNTTIVPNRV